MTPLVITSIQIVAPSAPTAKERIRAETQVLLGRIGSAVRYDWKSRHYGPRRTMGVIRQCRFASPHREQQWHVRKEPSRPRVNCPRQ